MKEFSGICLSAEMVDLLKEGRDYSGAIDAIILLLSDAIAHHKGSIRVVIERHGRCGDE